MSTPTNLPELLQWLMGPGAFLVITWAVSWALEGWNWWMALASSVKRLLILITAVALGIGSFVLQQNPALVATLDPYIKIVISMVVMWLSTQAAHKVDKALTSKGNPDHLKG